ncbi:MAG TPA: hypothetical protein VLC47_02360 [Burkholderiales bacterium]|nr:hypothetical protein [Burkholderiales bacterium]
MKNAVIPLALALACIPSLVRAECYTVYDKAGRIIYRDTFIPIDLSKPITEALQPLFPGGQLIIAVDTGTCTPIVPSSPVNPMAGEAAPEPSTTRMTYKGR